MNYRQFFSSNQISIEQFSVLLVRKLYGGNNTRAGNSGFDIENSRKGKIEVKSKITEGVGKASVVHCSDSKFKQNGMTHLAVVIVDPSTYEVKESWLLDVELAMHLRKSNTKSKYIPITEIRSKCAKNTTKGIKEISKELNEQAERLISI
jgi:hypothetical protein